jgi:uncharacterized protein (DUF2147 family)
MLFTFYKLRITSVGLAAILLFGYRPAMGAEGSPAGLWKTFDDRSHKARGTVRIYEQNGVFFGRIESSFNAAELEARCGKCAGERKDAPVIGLVVMRGMTIHGSEFDGGDILDPENGYIYRCRFVLSRDGEKLFVRGYLGLSIFGRTQTWIRVETNSEPAPPVTRGHSIASIGAESTK